MTNLAAPIERLIAELSKLPGIGRKSAQRLSFHLLAAPREQTEALARAILEVREKIRYCTVCFNLSEDDRCPICADPRRETATVCVVESPSDVAVIERSGVYRGVYHVLGGALSPLKDVGPEDLRIQPLLDRVREGALREAILATSSDVEGEATAMYLSRILKPLGLSVSRLAQGLPAGADLEFTDDLTLQRALEGRREY